MTWANQTRILKQNFEALGAVIGGTFINALKPLVSALNVAMGKVIQFAKVVSDALGKIFGWKIQITSAGVANDFEDAAGGAEDLASGTGAAADNAKKLKKQLSVLPFDELNQLAKAQEAAGSSGGGSGGGGAGGLGDTSGIEAQLVQTETIFDKFKSDIINLFDLGEYIGDSLTKSLNRIDWDSIYEGARNFGTGLADFLNGLISPELFGAVGRTIAGALNTAIYSALAFGERFDWKDLGLSIATGINEFFTTFDFSSLAKTINTWINGILDTIITFLDKTDWGMIGEKIGTFLADLDFLEIGMKIGKAIWKAINAGLKVWSKSFSSAPVATALLSLVAITKLLKTTAIQKFISTVSGGVSSVVKFGKALSGNKVALGELASGFPRLSKVVGTLSSTFQAFKYGVEGGNVFTGMNLAVTNLRNSMSNLAKGAVVAVAAIAEFAAVKNAVQGIADGTKGLAEGIVQIGIAATAAGAAMYVALGPAGIAIAAIVGVVAAIVGVKQAFNEIDAKKAGEDIKESFENPGGVPLKTIIGNFSESISEVGDGFDRISEKSEGLSTAQNNIKDTWSEINKIELAMDAGTMSVEEGTKKLSELFGTLASTAQEKFTSLENTLMAAFGEGGALHNSYEKMGVDTEELMKSTLQVNDSALKRIEEITSQLSTLDPTNPKYYELKSELSELLGTTDELSKAVGDYEAKIESTDIDYSGLIASDGTLDASKLQSYLGTVTGAISEADKSIETGVSSVRTSLEEELQSALNVGDYVHADEIKQALSVLPKAMSTLQTDITTKGTELTNALQTEFLQKMEQEITNAQTRWDEMKPWERFFSGFDNASEYAQNAATEYKTNYIDPISKQIEESFSELGISGAGWSSQTADDIINGLFTETVYGAQTGSPYVTTTLNTEYKKIFDDALTGSADDIKQKAAIVAKYPGDGLISGMKGSENSVLLAALGLFNKMSEGATLSEEELKTLYSTLGYDVPQSMIDSISQANVSGETQKQATELIGQLATAADSEKDDLIAKFESLGIDASDGYSVGLSQADPSKPSADMVNKAVKGVQNAQLSNSPSRVFKGLGKDAVDGYNLGITSNTGSTTTAITTWINGIQRIFDNQSPKLKVSGTDFMKNFLSGFNSYKGTITSSVTTFLQSVVTIFTQKEPTFKTKGSNAMSQFASGIKSSQNLATSAATNVANTIEKTMGGIERSMYSSGRGAAQAFANGFRSIHIPTPHLYISSWSKKGSGDVKVSVPNFSVNWYKMGGLFSGAQVIGVGEAGKEAVLPLENRKTMQMISDSIMENASMNMDEDTITSAVSRGVAMAMMNNQGNNQNQTLYVEVKTENDEVLARAVTRGMRKLDYRNNPTPQFGY